MIAEYWEMIVFRSNELLFYSMSYHSMFVTLNDITFGGNIYIHNFFAPACHHIYTVYPHVFDDEG